MIMKEQKHELLVSNRAKEMVMILKTHAVLTLVNNADALSETEADLLQ